MAVYKHQNHLHHSTHLAFDAPEEPGSPALHSGIFRCSVCGQEIVNARSATLPSTCPRSPATPHAGFHWQLVVASS